MGYDIINDQRGNDQRGYIEFNNSVVNFKDGDIVLFDHVGELLHLYPLKPKTTLIALCYYGQMSLKVNGKSLVISSDDVLVCPPNVKIEDINCSQDFDCKALCISEHVIQSLLRDRIEAWNHVVYIDQIYHITLSEVCKEEIGFYYSLIRSKLNTTRRPTPYQIMQSLLRALLLDLCFALEEVNGEMKDVKPSQGKVLFNRFLSMISNNEVKRQPIAYYASQLAITPKYLTMLCLKFSNKTASDWVIQYTTDDIRFYLKSSNLSIKEISAKLGFSNMSHFGSYVRKHMGMSPSQFRHMK